jgi:3-methyladenine DNA glycosylase AlkD
VVEPVETIVHNAATVLTMPEDVDRLVRLVRRRIAEAADPDRAPGMQAYMKSTMPYRGVPAAPLRTILTEVLAAHPLPDRSGWESGVRALWDDAAYREERYAAMALASHRLYRPYRDPAALDLYAHLVVTGAWWDYVDSIASHDVAAILVSHPVEVTPRMLAWSEADDLWLRRTAILCQLHRKQDTDLDLLRAVLMANLEGSCFGREFFIRKAIGWALRQHARVDPDWVRAFVTEHERALSGLSRREAMKHL